MKPETDFPAVELVNGIKIFKESGTNRKVSALRGCDLVISSGQLVSIIGPSGAGKTTLLRIIAGLTDLSSGEISIGGTSLNDMSNTLRQEFRRKYIGTFTQFGRQNFDPKMTVRQAITWETLQAGWSPKEANERTEELLRALELEYLSNNLCGQLSAGEAMRISFLKAVAKKPLIILADEPTGQLDTDNMQQLYHVMRQILETNPRTAIMVATHDIRFQAVSDKSLLILDGKLASEEDGAELLSSRSIYFDQVVQEKEEVTSKVIMDSNNSIRIPDSIIRRLNLGKLLKLSHSKNDEVAVIERLAGEQVSSRSEELIAEFSREHVTEKVVVEGKGIIKHYGDVEVLNDVNFRFYEGEIVVLLGPSGSGKTTLLNMIAGLENLTSGIIKVNGVDLQTSFSERRRIRTEEISYLTQNYIAHPSLSVKENSRLPLILKNTSDDKFDQMYQTILERLELLNFENRLPEELSGGQQQRTSFMASILKQTPILLADEPTANLDTTLAVKVMNIIIEQALKEGQTIILATHDFMMVQPNFRVIRISDDKIIDNVIADDKYCVNLQKLYLEG